STVLLPPTRHGADEPSPRQSGLLPRKGGRNQELALAALADIQDDEIILSFASDGHDNTDHAGAIADAETRAHARAQNLSSTEYLDGHRAYDFFTTTNDALVTGYTGSNVSDLIIALKK
ncbi:MAG: MOFRL family protein, partial [Patescibacteria group bacterium]